MLAGRSASPGEPSGHAPIAHVAQAASRPSWPPLHDMPRGRMAVRAAPNQPAGAMHHALRILMGEASAADVALLRRALRRGGYEAASEVVETPEAMRAAVTQQDGDLITSDHAMPGFSAPRALALVKDVCPEGPFLMVSGAIELHLAVSLRREGAQDYMQNRELARLVPAIARAWRDVAARRARQRAEAARREHEARGQLLVEGVKDPAMFRLDPAGDIVRGHAGAACLQGDAPEASLGQHCSRVYRPEDRAPQRPAHAREVAMAAGQVEAEGWWVGQEGGPFWAQVVITALRDEAGQVRGVVQVSRDVTERRHLAERLRASATRERRRVASARDGILLRDAGTHTITDVNPCMVELLGYTREALLGKALWDIGVLTDAAASREAFRVLQAIGDSRYED
jgi:PAS domain S-box-containing protein